MAEGRLLARRDLNAATQTTGETAKSGEAQDVGRGRTRHLANSVK